MVQWKSSFLEDLLEMYLPLDNLDADHVTDTSFEDINLGSFPTDLDDINLGSLSTDLDDIVPFRPDDIVPFRPDDIVPFRPDDIVPLASDSDHNVNNNCLVYGNGNVINLLIIDYARNLLTLHSVKITNLIILPPTPPITANVSNTSRQCQEVTVVNDAHQPTDPDHCMLGSSTEKIDCTDISMQTSHEEAPDCNILPLAPTLIDDENKLNLNETSSQKLELNQKSKVEAMSRKKLNSGPVRKIIKVKVKKLLKKKPKTDPISKTDS